MSKAEELATAIAQPSVDGDWYYVPTVTDLQKAAAHLRALEANRQMLVEALSRAKDDLEEWGGYVSDYFKYKHDFEDDLAAIDAALEQAKELT